MNKKNYFKKERNVPLTRKEINKRFYSKHREKVIKWSTDYFKRTQFNPKRRKQRAKSRSAWRKENWWWRRYYKKIWTQRKKLGLPTKGISKAMVMDFMEGKVTPDLKIKNRKKKIRKKKGGWYPYPETEI